MDLSGCEAFLAHRYGHATRHDNEAALIRHLEAALARLGFAARAAVAPTVGLAWAACRFGDESIEAAPSVGNHAGSASREAMPTMPIADGRAERTTEGKATGSEAASKRAPESVAARSRVGLGSNQHPDPDRGLGRAVAARACDDDRGRGSKGGRLPRIVEREAMDRVLAAMPIEALRLDADSIEGFRQLSIDRIESLLRLDRDEVTARFGPRVARRLDEALGLRDEPITPVRVEPPIEVERIFATPVASQEGVRLAMQAMLAELCRRLRRRERGAVRLRLEVERVDRGVEAIALSLGAPSRRAGHLAALLDPKIERLDAGLGIERLALLVLRSGRLPHRQKGLGFDRESEFGVKAAPARRGAGQMAAQANAPACELADALIARLGEGAIRSPHAIESHLPEASGWSATDPHGQAPSIEWSVAPRPSRLTDPPEPVFIEFESAVDSCRTLAGSAPQRVHEFGVGGPEGVAASDAGDGSNSAWASNRGRVLRWRGVRHRIDRWIGPERIAEAWWRRDEDAPVGESIVTREYWRARLESGWWLWLFRRVVESASAAERLRDREAAGEADARIPEAGDGRAATDATMAVAIGSRRIASAADAAHARAVGDAPCSRDPCVDGDESDSRVAFDRWYLHGVWS
ncbi:MAG: hypothetical protein ACO3EP_12320 [Phycisphaerales bacterium]